MSKYDKVPTDLKFVEREKVIQPTCFMMARQLPMANRTSAMY